MTSTTPPFDYYVIEFTHRASRRRFTVDMEGEVFAKILTGMGGMYCRFTEKQMFKLKDAKPDA